MKTIMVRKVKNINKEIMINISGSKNALLHLIFGSLIPDTRTTFTNVPINILDYKIAKDIVIFVGAKVFERGENIIIDTGNISNNNLELTKNITSKIRSSIMLLGALVKKKKRIKIGFPGGCIFNKERSFNIHLNGLSALGAEVKLLNNTIEVIYKEEKNAIFKMPYPSVGATINLIMYSVIGHSKVILENIALEPEVITLIDYFKQCGANINFFAKIRRVKIIGVIKLIGCNFKIIFDRIQIMTYAAMAYLHKTNVIIKNINIKDIYNIKNPLKQLNYAGAKWEYDSINNKIKFLGKNSCIHGINIIAAPFPSFPTDLQPIYAVMLFIANSSSTIKDIVYPDRVNYIYQIRKMGFDIYEDNDLIKIKPIKNIDDIHPAIMNVKDLRAGMACLMAGSLLYEFSIINNAHHIFRGYNNLITNMSNFVQIKIIHSV